MTGSVVTDHSDLSLGRWRVTNISSGVPIQPGTEVELRVSDTHLLVVGSDGATLGSWPFSDAAMDVHGNTDGCLRLGSQAIWIKSVEKRPSHDVREAILARRLPGADPASPSGAPPAGSVAEGFGCALVAIDTVVLAIIWWSWYAVQIDNCCSSRPQSPVPPAQLLSVLVIGATVVVWIAARRIGSRGNPEMGRILPEKGIWRAVLAFVAIGIVAMVTEAYGLPFVVVYAVRVLGLVAAVLAYQGRI